MRLGLLIFANNLGAVAFVGRTLYGIALAICSSRQRFRRYQTPDFSRTSGAITRACSMSRLRICLAVSKLPLWTPVQWREPWAVAAGAHERRGYRQKNGAALPRSAATRVTNRARPRGGSSSICAMPVWPR